MSKRDGFPTWLKAFYYVCKITALYDLAIRKHLPPEIETLYNVFRSACDALAVAIEPTAIDDPNP